jgi:hypothetical protein
VGGRSLPILIGAACGAADGKTVRPPSARDPGLPESGKTLILQKVRGFFVQTICDSVDYRRIVSSPARPLRNPQESPRSPFEECGAVGVFPIDLPEQVVRQGYGYPDSHKVIVPEG